MIDAPMPAPGSPPRPHWDWLIIFYFFLGGLAGGCYFLAALIDLFGAAGGPAARAARLLRRASRALLVSGILLIVDLARPERFWHMLVESHTWRPMFKSWSPMSVGSWALLAFGFFALLSLARGAGGGGPAALAHRAALPPARPPGHA